MASISFVERSPFFPPRTPGVSRWSPSAVEEYLGCGHRFLLRRIQGRWRIRTYLAIGRAVHSVAEVDSLLKKTTGEPLKRGDAIDYAASQYDQAFREKKEVNGQEIEVEVTETRAEIESGRDLAASGGGSYASWISPRIISPQHIEVPILTRFSADTGPIEVAVILDLTERVGGGEVIRDLKTGKRRKAVDYAHGRGQLTAQGIALQAHTGALPMGYSIEDLAHTRKGWEYQRLETTRTPQDFACYWKRLMAVDAAVSAGSFPPAPEGSWLCSPGWCEYWEECEYVSTRRRYQKESND